MEYLTLLLVLFFVLACIHVLTFDRGSRNSGSPRRPPGPKPLPIIGNILELGNRPHHALARLSKIYGPLMTLKLGSRTAVVISSPDIAKEALKTNDQVFSSRTIPDTSRTFNHHKFSVAWLPASTQWRKLRKVSAMQIFAPQRLDATQALRRVKVQQLLDHVQACCSSGRAEIIWGSLEEAGRPNISDFFPVLRFIDPQGARRRMTTYYAKLSGILDGIINKRVQLRALSKSSKPNGDVLDSLLNLTEEDNPDLRFDDIKRLFMDLFVAGNDTTTSTVEWAMAELLRDPSKMAKTREEAQEVLGNVGLVQESDILKLPYLQAVVKETLRLHPPGPLLIPHKAEADVEMCGFTVPKNAQILVNVWAMGRDSSIWPNPTLFSPERFLEKDIDYKGRDFELIPFGAGRRICPGLPLASRMVSFILASLVYSFHWKLPAETKPEDLDMSEAAAGFTLHRTKPLLAIPITSV
ncbi:Cytochrome P450 76C4 [Morella rubra]|uniref:Cytochrome P450 76C4 n=1 Tax=Morella rubra TaxID=262757 RepID=A0A6A1W7U6_9ROSI|nr:Cytochrome P450 76C4 [Morella rubra]